MEHLRCVEERAGVVRRLIDVRHGDCVRAAPCTRDVHDELLRRAGGERPRAPAIRRDGEPFLLSGEHDAAVQERDCGILLSAHRDRVLAEPVPRRAGVVREEKAERRAKEHARWIVRRDDELIRFGQTRVRVRQSRAREPNERDAERDRLATPHSSTERAHPHARLATIVSSDASSVISSSNAPNALRHASKVGATIAIRTPAFASSNIGCSAAHPAVGASV